MLEPAIEFDWQSCSVIRVVGATSRLDSAERTKDKLSCILAEPIRTFTGTMVKGDRQLIHQWAKGETAPYY